MSMIAHFRLVDSAVTTELAEYDDEKMADFLFPEDGALDMTLDTDKAWAAIDYLVSAATRGQVTTLLGGSELGPDLGYGPAMYLAPDKVREVAGTLEALDRTTLLEHYDGESMQNDDVYPSVWDDSQGMRDYIGDNFERVRGLFLDGVREGRAVLAWLA